MLQRVMEGPLSAGLCLQAPGGISHKCENTQGAEQLGFGES